MPATIALSWIPLWGALLTKLRSSDTDAGDPASAGTRTKRPRRPRK